MSKSSDLLKQYNKALGQLKRAITAVEKEGYEAYTQLPNRVKKPTEASIRKIKNLTDMVWEHSFKVNDKGEKEIRLILQKQVKKAQATKKELLQGEKILSKAEQKAYLTGIKESIDKDLYGDELIALRGIFDTIMDSFFLLEGANYDVRKYAEEYKRQFVRWVNRATPEEIKEADKQIDWEKLMVQFYDSEGPGRGLEPFLEEMENELAKLEGIRVVNDTSYASLSPEQRLLME